MKKFEITEEQIKKIHECTSVSNQEELEKWFPEAFKPQLEVGKWYFFKDNNGEYLYCLKENKSCYGFFRGIWADKSWYTTESFLEKSRLATDEEVKEALVKEAERRGFKKDVRFKEIKDQMNCDYFPEKLRNVGSMFDFSDNKLYASGYGKWCIFKDGVWTEVVKEPVTLNYQQIADKFGVDVEQLRISKE